MTQREACGPKVPAPRPAERSRAWDGVWKWLLWGLDASFWGRLRWHFQELGLKDLADSGKDLGDTT